MKNSTRELLEKTDYEMWKGKPPIAGPEILKGVYIMPAAKLINFLAGLVFLWWVITGLPEWLLIVDTLQWIDTHWFKRFLFAALVLTSVFAIITAIPIAALMMVYDSYYYRRLANHMDL